MEPTPDPDADESRRPRCDQQDSRSLEWHRIRDLTNPEGSVIRRALRGSRLVRCEEHEHAHDDENDRKRDGGAGGDGQLLTHGRSHSDPRTVRPYSAIAT